MFFATSVTLGRGVIDPAIQGDEHAAVLQGHLGDIRIARLQCRGRLHIARHHRQFLGRGISGQATGTAGAERDSIEGQAGDLGSSRVPAGQDAHRVPGMKDKSAQVRGFAESVQCHLLRIGATELRHQQRHGPRRRILQRQFDFDRVGLERFPVDLEFLAGRIACSMM